MIYKSICEKSFQRIFLLNIFFLGGGGDENIFITFILYEFYMNIIYYYFENTKLFHKMKYLKILYRDVILLNCK